MSFETKMLIAASRSVFYGSVTENAYLQLLSVRI